ncbi:flagellar motor protein MotB [Dokdonia pacifica]|uniref:Chemotaxis protein MotB n=1 Tax=Dokdonia pacifica TaxID=1627892 RepID=A0A238VQG9_9FLAO|nr:flagellar motor protein MotB [Dokdonia pacifica]GGG18805.1 flagellar motor protein MotB [Dokdonia pacifica]SNR36575.1 chemotaxis protein MotB [Dokdonia pacifica]
MKKTFVIIAVATLTLTSCVSKKKYVALQSEYDNTKVTLTKTKVEKEELENKYGAIQARVSEYNSKINSLKDINDQLTISNDQKLDKTTNGAVISNDVKKQMTATLAKVDQAELSKARTLEDSMNLALSYNLKRNLDRDVIENVDNDDISIDIDETVVMISISDKLLFKSGSYRVNKEADALLKRIADVVNSEPAIEVMVEGHTDNQSVKPGAYVKDNWELSVERSTAIIRELQNTYQVDPSKLIAAGRSSYMPIAPNDSKENRSINRRTRIIILPNLDKFLALMASNE